MSGWIKIHRSVLEHWIWQDPLKFYAWCDLIMLANWKPGRTADGFKIKDVPRGSFITSQAQLAERWKVSRWWIQGFLRQLESDSMITQKTSTRNTYVTICNYERYQDKETTDQQQTSTGPAPDQQQTSTIEEVKKGKKGRINTKSAVDPFIEFPHLEAARGSWEQFLEYRRASRKPLSAVSHREQLSKWKSAADLTAAIQNSIANGYQGIFPPKQTARPSHQQTVVNAVSEFIARGENGK